MAVMALSPRCSWLALTAGTAAAATVLLAAAVATVLLATVLLAVAVATVLAAAVAAAVSMTGVLDPFALLEVEVDTVVIMAALVVFPAAGPLLMTLPLALFMMALPLAPCTAPATFALPFHGSQRCIIHHRCLIHHLLSVCR